MEPEDKIYGNKIWQFKQKKKERQLISEGPNREIDYICGQLWFSTFISF